MMLVERERTPDQADTDHVVQTEPKAPDHDASDDSWVVVDAIPMTIADMLREKEKQEEQGR